jgi:hypothetical protein
MTFTAILLLDRADTTTGMAGTGAAVTAAVAAKGGGTARPAAREETLGTVNTTSTRCALLAALLDGLGLETRAGGLLTHTRLEAGTGTPLTLTARSLSVLLLTCTTTGAMCFVETTTTRVGSIGASQFVEDSLDHCFASGSPVTTTCFGLADLGISLGNLHMLARGGATRSLVTQFLATWLNNRVTLARAHGGGNAFASARARSATDTTALAGTYFTVDLSADSSADITSGGGEWCSGGGGDSGGGGGRTSGGNLACFVQDTCAMVHTTSMTRSLLDTGTVSSANGNKLGTEARSRGGGAGECGGGGLAVATLLDTLNTGRLSAMLSAALLETILIILGLSSPSLPHSPAIAELLVFAQVNALAVPLDKQLPGIAGTFSTGNTLSHGDQTLDVSLATVLVLAAGNTTSQTVEATATLVQTDKFANSSLVALVEGTTEVTNLA